LLLTGFLVLLLVMATVSAQAAPRTPTDDAEVLERLPVQAGAGGRGELAALRQAARRDPASLEAALALAEFLFSQALAQGDPRPVGQAEAELRRVAGPAAEASPAWLSLRAQLRQYRHDFDGALADLAAALQRDPTLAEAHAWRGAIFLVQADLTAAKAECDALGRLGRDILQAACLGLVQAYGGQLAQADRTLSRGQAEAALAETRHWFLTRRAEVAAWRGQPAEAERHYQAARQLGQDDAYRLAAHADFLLDQGRPAEVLRLLAGWDNADPLLLRIAEAEAALKQPGLQARLDTLAERFAAAGQRGDTTHRAEEARYWRGLRGEPARALQLARANYEVQREPRDARVLLECALAAREPAAAEPAIAWLRRSGFEDPRLRELARQLGAADLKPAVGS
jgi:Tfp pilus assembly protein PilF